MTDFTEKDFELFKKVCKKWHEKLSLKSWDLKILFEDNLANRGAECRTNSNQRQAQIVLYKKNELVKEEEKKEYIEKTAIHEIVHILTADYANKLESDEEEIRISESISNTLSDVLYELSKND